MDDARDQRVPSWAREPFLDFRDYLFEEHHLHVLTLRGVVALAEEDPFGWLRRDLESAEASGRRLTTDERWRLATLRRDREYADEEYRRGYPMLFAHAAVSLWGVLEALVEDLVLAWLEHEPTALTREKVAALTFPLGEVLGADRRRLAERVLAELQRGVKGDRRGAGQFQPLLDVFGLAPVLGSEASRTLVEIQQVRHVIVHRRGVVDEKFLAACSWLRERGGTPGDRVQVTHDDYIRY